MDDKELKDYQTRTLKKVMADLRVVPKSDQLWSQKDAFLMRLVRTRLKRGLSQEDVASKTGLPQSVIARIESGRGNPTLLSLLKIAKALDVNLVLE